MFMAVLVIAMCIFLQVTSQVTSSNIAVFKPAYQSSTHNFYPCGLLKASKAVDNDRNPDTYSCHCSHVKDVYGDPNWLAIDLGMKHQMDYVVVYNRNGNKILSGRLSYFWVGLTNIDVTVVAPERGQYPLCGQYPDDMSFVPLGLVKCNYNLPPGRFLIVQMDLDAGDGKAMAVCELEAYAVDTSRTGFIWKPKRAKRLIGYDVASVPSPHGLLSCVIACISRTLRCDSINYSKERNACELNVHPNGFNVTSFVNSTEWKFWTGTF